MKSMLIAIKWSELSWRCFLSGDFGKFPLTCHRKIKKGDQGIRIRRVKKTF